MNMKIYHVLQFTKAEKLWVSISIGYVILKAENYEHEKISCEVFCILWSEAWNHMRDQKEHIIANIGVGYYKVVYHKIPLQKWKL